MDTGASTGRIDGLRIADASIMPRITTGNTMAPCVVIGEKAAEFILAAHGLLAAHGVQHAPVVAEHG